MLLYYRLFIIPYRKPVYTTWAGLRIGSTSRTWLASTRFRPLAPREIGSSRTLTSSRFYGVDLLSIVQYLLYIGKASLKRKSCRMLWNVKICILKEFRFILYLFFFSKSYILDLSKYAFRKIIFRNLYFFGANQSINLYAWTQTVFAWLSQNFFNNL